MAAGLSDRLLDMSEIADAPPADDLQEARGVSRGEKERPMDLPGEAYLFNLSLLAITFAAVSVFVMLLRQTMGGKLSNYDIHLVTTYVSQGFVVSLCAILPSLAADFVLSPTAAWAIASGLAAILLGSSRVYIQRRRSKTASGAPPPFLVFVYTANWLLVLLLVANAAVPALQHAGLFKVALSLSLALAMLGFVRRVASLLGDKPSDDWDPRRA
jgi:hypothetical protein